MIGFVQPTIGRIVHYVVGVRQVAGADAYDILPAMVTSTDSLDGLTGLCVYLDSPKRKYDDSRAGYHVAPDTDEERAGTMFRAADFSEKDEVGTWHWPVTSKSP